MPLTQKRVQELINSGESQSVEFKATLPPEESVARVLASFANSDGGTLLIGVNENGEIVGVPDDYVHVIIDVLKAVSSSLLRWSIPVGSVIVSGRRVVYAHVGKAPPEYAPVVTSRGHVFVRRGVMSEQLPRPEMLPTPTTTAPPPRPVVLFVAMSFREEEEPSLVDYWKAIQRAAKETGLPINIRRVDLIDGDYEISQRVMDEIDAADIVLADLTLNPRNVYFELGYARAKGRQIIQTARKDTVLEFDIRSWRTLFYRNATELETKLLSPLRTAYEDTPSKIVVRN